MKVRHKATGKECEVYGTLNNPAEHVHLFRDGAWGYVRDYEPIPSETWRDVTGECVTEVQGRGKNSSPYIEEGEFVLHNGHKLAKLICGGTHRLRKVQLRSYELTRWAFIVEKRD